MIAFYIFCILNTKIIYKFIIFCVHSTMIVNVFITKRSKDINPPPLPSHILLALFLYSDTKLLFQCHLSLPFVIMYPNIVQYKESTVFSLMVQSNKTMLLCPFIICHIAFCHIAYCHTFDVPKTHLLCFSL